MKIYTLILTLIILCSCTSKSQIVTADYGFEKYDKGVSIPKNWFTWGGCKIEKDSLISNSGNYSVSIMSVGDQESSGVIAYKLPYNLPGREIKLVGYIKTKNVIGKTGLVLRIDNEDENLELNNMLQQNINGTRDWKKYEVKVPMHADATAIFIGGILSGSGKVWFDDFSVYIDGKKYYDVLSETDDKELLFIDTKSKESINAKYNDSNFRITTVTEDQINNLYELAKVWGYLKYHNPLVSSGNYNWDQELFSMLPSIESTNFETRLYTWKKSFLTDQKMEYNKYVKFAKGVNNPIFTNEPIYYNIDWKDTGYKLLGLFRFWNMIEYFYPYKHLIKDWDAVLRDYIERIIKTDDEPSYKLLMLRLIGEINDTHSASFNMGSIIEDFFGFYKAPVEIKYLENQFVISKVFDKNLAVYKGDVIKKINGKNINRTVNILKKYAIGSNESALMRDVCSKLLRSNKKNIRITVQRGSDDVDIEISCLFINQVNLLANKYIQSNLELDNDIGYIYMGSLKKGEINQIMEKFMDKKGVIIDLRCYPSDFVVFSLSDYLMPRSIEFVKFSQGSLTSPGKFDFTSPLSVGRDNPDYYKGRIAILVDEYTQSQAEYTAMALRKAPLAKVIGSQTAGADGNVSKIELPGGISFHISGVGVYYPNGRETQGIGIVPDITIKPTIQGLSNNKDEVLDRAKKYILEGK